MPNATPASILKNLEDALTPLVEAEKGRLDVATDLDHALEILADAPRRFRVVITWEGYGDHPNAREGMNSLRFVVILHQHCGLARGGKAVHREAHKKDDPAFLDHLEKISGWVRAMRWPDGYEVDHAGFSLADSQWVSDVPGKTRAHAMTFNIDVALSPLPELIDVSEL